MEINSLWTPQRQNFGNQKNQVISAKHFKSSSNLSQEELVMLSLDLSLFPLGSSGWLHWLTPTWVHILAWTLLRLSMEQKDDGVGWQAGQVLTSGFAAHSLEWNGSLPPSSKYQDIISFLVVSWVNSAASETWNSWRFRKGIAREQLWNLVFLAPSSPSVLKEEKLLGELYLRDTHRRH